MSLDHHRVCFSRRLRYLALAAILGVSASALTQCRWVEDRVSGLEFKTNAEFHGRSSSCKKLCKKKYKTCKRAEERRHRKAKKACKDLPKDLKEKCKEAEKQRHKKEKQACKDTRKLCRKACDYREGSGRGGR